MPQKNYLLDTSVILDDPQNIQHIYQNGENQVAVTNVVLAELDNKKTGNNDTAFFAREFFRMIAGDNGKSVKKSPYKGKKIQERDFFRKMELEFDGEVVPLIVIYREQFKEHHDKNDSKIAEVAKDYDLTLLTNDIAFKVRSLAKGINVESIQRDSVDNPAYFEFFHSFNVKDEEEIGKFSEKPQFQKITDWNMIEIDEEMGRKHFGLKINGQFEELQLDELQDKKDVYIPPVNLEQKLFFSMMTHPQNQITVCSGSTGSGKTLMALQAGIHLKNQGIVDGIVYIRNTVTSSDREAELGFRKGDQSQKLGYFMYPLYATINFTIEKIRKDSWDNAGEYTGDTNSIDKQAATDKFIQNHNIEMIDIAHARGTTISKKFVIFDEAQNISNGTLKLIGTRMGKESKMVVLGDWSQIDHPYLTKERNGLMTLLTKAVKDNFVAGIHLKHTIRSEVAKWFDEQFR
ncbi:MAG: PhoH family protein [Campylobacterales bacterium]|nr:PhoH family protein [Campylobacterales bacterium]